MAGAGQKNIACGHTLASGFAHEAASDQGTFNFFTVGIPSCTSLRVSGGAFRWMSLLSL